MVSCKCVWLLCAGLALGACSPRRAVSVPCPAVAVPAPTDPKLVDLVERTERALREATLTLHSDRPDPLSELSRQRLGLVAQLESSEAEAEKLSARIGAAERKLRKTAQSEHERALIAESLLDLSAGRPVERELPVRLGKREEYRDCVEAYELLAQSRLTQVKLRAAIRTIDLAFAQLAKDAPRNAAPKVTPPKSTGLRSIEPAL